MSITRRQFLKNGSIALSAATILPPWLEGVAAHADQSGGVNGRILIVIELSGGNDGLNMVIPYQDGRYHDLRNKIGLNEANVLPLTSELALHPAMGKLQSLFKQGKLAIIEGAGYPNPNRSHFRSMEIWQTANPVSIEYYGWLGRYLDTDGHFKNPLQAIFMGQQLPQAMSAGKADVPALDSLESYGILSAGRDRAKTLSLYKQIYTQSSTKGSIREHVQNVGLEALSSSEELRARVKASEAVYPQSSFAQQLKEIARVLTSGIGTTVAYARLGGFDTHAGQVNRQQLLFTVLSDGLSAFWSDITARGLSDKVLLFTFSEFGRRAKENGAQGTDHGTAGPMFVIGGKIKGGKVYGDPPDLGNLDGNGDLKYQIDFRSVYATVLDRWLGTDPTEALGAKYKLVDFV